MRRPLALAALLLVALAVPAAAENPAEVKAEVPALADFHEVIYPLWHTAWPAKDVAMLRELLPQVQEGVARIEKVELPGILRDKLPAWQKGVAGLKESAVAYEKALAADDQQAVLDAAEQLHARYEGLVRVVRPPMKELDAYHQVLYRVFHHLWPGRKLDELRTASAELATACGALAAAPMPKRFASREATVRPELTALCAATDALGVALEGSDEAAIGAAVEQVHTQYQKVEKSFE